MDQQRESAAYIGRVQFVEGAHYAEDVDGEDLVVSLLAHADRIASFLPPRDPEAGRHLMTVLVVGATGMTGQALVEQLLSSGQKVRAIVRSPRKLSAKVREHPNATVIEASVLDLTDEKMGELVKDCDAVVSCLGHVMDLKGVFGEPKRLCTDATRCLCDAIAVNRPSAPAGARIKGCVKERRRTFPLTINQRVPGCHPGERNVAS